MNQSIVWPKKKKTEEKRKIEFQSKRRKREKPRTANHLDLGTQDGEMGLLQSCETEKKKKRKREEKRKEKEERRGKKAVLQPSTLCHFRWGKWSILVGTRTLIMTTNPISAPLPHAKRQKES